MIRSRGSVCRRGCQSATWIPDRTRYVHLVDGGVSDNLALCAGIAVMQNMVLSPEEMRASGLDRVRRF